MLGRFLKELYRTFKNEFFEYAKECGRELLQYIWDNPEEAKEKLKYMRDTLFRDPDRDHFLRVRAMSGDQKRNLEELCKIKFAPQWRTYMDCRCRISHSGTGHCTIQYFEYWRRVDREVSRRLFQLLK